MEPTAADWLQAGASVLTMAAAFAALLIAAKAPRLAASYAEQYRRETAQADEARALQLWVFRTLMKGRAEITHHDTRAAINLVEAAFPNNPKVRAARRLFSKSASAQPFDQNHFVQTYLSLVEAVTVAVGLGDEIDRFDIGSGYYPLAINILEEAALAEAAAKISRSAQLGGPPETGQ